MSSGDSYIHNVRRLVYEYVVKKCRGGVNHNENDRVIIMAYLKRLLQN